MTVGDILALAAPDTQVTICERDGMYHYVGVAHSINSFNEHEIYQVTVSGGQLVLIIKSDYI